jgi:GT2 family glycosyltransferase
MNGLASQPLRVGVTIPTHNRRNDLQRTCAAISALQPPPDEVLVCADGCTDDTMEFLRANHPTFRVFENKPARGSIAARDLMIRNSTSDVLLSLDDDSYPVEADFIDYVRQIFRENPKLAVASFPQRSDEYPKSLTAKSVGSPHPAGTFANCAAAISRPAYLATNGYPACFFHMYEEPDFALQCLAGGGEVLHVTGRTVRHHYTPQQRSELRRHLLNARNELWSVMLRCPMPCLLPVAFYRVVRQFAYACTRGAAWTLRQPLWWAAFLVGLPQILGQRKPVPWRVYLDWMQRIRNAPKKNK